MLIISEGVIVQYQDAEGQIGRLAIVGCPVHKGELIIALTNGTHPLHCSAAEALQLVEVLRAGEAWPRLQPSKNEELRQEGARGYMERMTMNAGAWMVTYRPSFPGVCFFTAHGADPVKIPPPHRIALTAAQRQRFSDAIFQALMTNAPSPARA